MNRTITIQIKNNKGTKYPKDIAIMLYNDIKERFGVQLTVNYQQQLINTLK